MSNKMLIGEIAAGKCFKDDAGYYIKCAKDSDLGLDAAIRLGDGKPFAFTPDTKVLPAVVEYEFYDGYIYTEISVLNEHADKVKKILDKVNKDNMPVYSIIRAGGETVWEVYLTKKQRRKLVKKLLEKKYFADVCDAMGDWEV